MINTGTSVPFALVDVFADEPLTGNPLAVVAGADGLSGQQMQRIAREFNQSETTFLVQPDRPGVDRRLRSFTAAGSEVVGAGHNALGAWLWLAGSGRLGPDPARQWTQQIGHDVLPVRITADREARYTVTMTQGRPSFGPPLSHRRELAHALGLAESDLHAELPTGVGDTGAAHLLVAVTDPATVDRVQVDASALREVLRSAGGEGCYVYALPSSADVDAYARFFNPTMGIVEDPATGTAAGPLAAALVRDRGVGSGGITVLQGQAMGRPSRLRVDVDGETVQLVGGGLIVAEGLLSL